MDPERWRRIEELLQAAADMDPDERAAFLERSCRDDPSLLREVRSLLEYHDHTDDFLESPPSEAAAILLSRIGTGSLVNQTVGRYEIVESIGAGGMGEVYRARDSELRRDVALKILPTHYAMDPRRLKLFRREARAASALNHPNIITIHEIGHAGPLHYLVMELVSGQTLRKKLSSGAIPLQRALPIALQVAEGLACAHAAGITHSDLKPENIMITEDGRAKILDFGLARLSPDPAPPGGPGPGDSLLTGDPASALVGGTAGYMAPEHSLGPHVTFRADQFAFGAILYEMVTGRRAFEGETRVERISAALNDDPPSITEVVPTVPPPLQWMIERCLSKEPEERYASTLDLAQDLRLLIRRLAEIRPVREPLRAPAVARRGRALLWAAPLLLAGLAIVVWLGGRPSDRPPDPVRFSIPPLPQSRFTTTGILSPDGQRLVFSAISSGNRTRLWIRDLNAVVPRVLALTENATAPFWSPDGKAIGFFANGRLRTLDLSGAVPRDLCEAADGRGGAWSPDGIILFAPGTRDPLYRVPSSGGTPVPVTRLNPKGNDISHRWPVFLPGGRDFLYISLGDVSEERSLYVGSLDSRPTRKLVPGATAPSFLPPDRLLYSWKGDLFVQSFNLERLQPEGSPVLAIRQISYNHGRAEAEYSVSDNGHLTFREAANLNTQLVWFDRSGKELGIVGPPGQYRNPELSYDETRVAVDVADPRLRTSDIWVFHVKDHTHTRLVQDLSDNSSTAWSPDDTQVAFSSNRRGRWEIFTKAGASEQPLLEDERQKSVLHWSRDGRFLLYNVHSATTRNDLWIMPLFGDRRPYPFLNTEAIEIQGRISPNGRWIAYASNESGTLEVYVRPFTVTGLKWKVSADGGGQPVWRRDGVELFYLAADKKLMAVTVRDGKTLRLDTPRPLFQTQVLPLTNARTHYAVSADGERFLVSTPVQDPDSRPITAVLNWGLQGRP